MSEPQLHEIPYSSPEAETRLSGVIDAARHDARAGRGSNPPKFPAAATLVYWLAWSDETLRGQIEAAQAAIPEDIATRRKGETDEKLIAERIETFVTSLVPRLKSPDAVHVNMLSGTIARPSIAQIVHLYGREALLAATLTPAEYAVIAERRRQVEEEGWTPEHDDAHRGAALTLAAIAYATQAGFGIHSGLTDAEYRTCRAPSMWPWERSWWKPKSPIRDLVRSAALCVAEIERLERAAAEDVAR